MLQVQNNKQAIIKKAKLLKQLETTIADDLEQFNSSNKLATDFIKLIDYYGLEDCRLTTNILHELIELNHSINRQIENDIYIHDLNLYQLKLMLKKLDGSKRYTDLISNCYYSDRWYFENSNYVDFETQMKQQNN